MLLQCIAFNALQPRKREMKGLHYISLCATSIYGRERREPNRTIVETQFRDLRFRSFLNPSYNKT